MLELMTFIKAMVIGFTIAIPVGPIGLLCINKTLHQGLKAGLSVGLGVAFADGFFSFIAASSLALVQDIIINNQTLIKLFGAAILIVLATLTLREKDHAIEVVKESPVMGSNIVLGFFMTLANPLAILSFIGVFSIIGYSFSVSDMPWLVLGVFSGSLLWWTLLSNLTNFSRQFLPQSVIKKIRRVSLVIILTLATLTLLDVFYRFFF